MSPFHIRWGAWVLYLLLHWKCLPPSPLLPLLAPAPVDREILSLSSRISSKLINISKISAVKVLFNIDRSSLNKIQRGNVREILHFEEEVSGCGRKEHSCPMHHRHLFSLLQEQDCLPIGPFSQLFSEYYVSSRHSLGSVQSIPHPVFVNVVIMNSIAVNSQGLVTQQCYHITTGKVKDKGAPSPQRPRDGKSRGREVATEVGVPGLPNAGCFYL